MTKIERAVSEARAAHDAWREAMRTLHRVALVRMVGREEQATVEVAADVLAGSVAGADEAMQLAFLDAVAVVGTTVSHASAGTTANRSY